MLLQLTSDPGIFEDFLTRIRTHANNCPTALALKDSVRSRTWQEFSSIIHKGAAALSTLGVGRDDKVAILLENGVPFIEAFFSITGSGSCVVTLPTMLPANAVVRILDNAQPSLVISSPSLLPLLNQALGQVELVKSVQVISCDEFFQIANECQNLAFDPQVSPDTDFNIVYSSGTTGDPKGILHSYATRVSQSNGMAGLGFNTSTVTLISTPLYTNLSIPALLGTIWNGGLSIVMEKFDEQKFLQLIESDKATHFYLVPVQIQRLINTPGFGQYDLSSSQLVYVAGSMFHPNFKERLSKLWPGKLVEVYGMTEGAPASLLVINENPDKLTSVGKPVTGCEVRIIDDSGNELSAGKVGEIIGRSGTMMKGYYNRPQDTEELIWRDKNGKAFFRSGDLGYFDEDGFLYIVDRKKDMIISGGLNVYASDIEDVIADHEDVAEVAVIGVPSERWGETPVALIVTYPGVHTTPQDFQHWINERVAKHQRVAKVEIRNSFPRNALGKILKRELRAEMISKGVQL